MTPPVSAASEGRSFNVGYVEIHSQSERVCITHNGHAAIVQRGRSGNTAALHHGTQLNSETPRHVRSGAWLIRAISALAADFRRLAQVVAPRAGAALPRVE